MEPIAADGRGEADVADAADAAVHPTGHASQAGAQAAAPATRGSTQEPPEGTLPNGSASAGYDSAGADRERARVAADAAGEFLQRHLAEPGPTVQRHLLRGRQVWIKRAGAPHPEWPYWVLGAIARLARLPALAPVPNHGGEEAIRIESSRLRDLAARGLRVPVLLAAQPQGLLMSHLGRPGEATPSLAEEMNESTGTDPAAVLAMFCQGLGAVGLVHAAGTCLSQAFARNLVRCPDGVVGYIDFEDDPTAVMSLAQCQVRDVLCYVHSAAVYLHEAGQLDAAREPWHSWLAQQPTVVRVLVQSSARRMRWLRFLPQNRRFGRDLQRARAAWALLSPR